MSEKHELSVRSFTITAVFLCCLSILTGCAVMPTQVSSSHTRDLYKRVPYMVEGRYRIMDIFYATSREMKDTEDDSVDFNRDMGKGLTYGDLTVKIDPGIKIGKMLPGRLKRKGLVGVQDVKTMKENVFIKKVSDAVNASPHRSLLVMIFGYNDDFEATAIKAAYFSYLLDVNTPVLLFDWPGDQPMDIWGYKQARSYAEASGPYLGGLLAKIIREVRPEKLWINASSLGGQVVCDAFEEMYKSSDLSDKDTEISHVVLAAPDVGEDEFDERFKEEIASLSGKLTTYVSSDDEALLISGIIEQEKRLGRKGVDEDAQLEEAKDMLYLKSMDPDRISLIDVTPINNSSYKHGYYLESPEFYDDFYMRIFGEKPNANRCLYLMKVEGKTDYWILRESE